MKLEYQLHNDTTVFRKLYTVIIQSYSDNAWQQLYCNLPIASAVRFLNSASVALLCFFSAALKGALGVS